MKLGKADKRVDSVRKYGTLDFSQRIEDKKRLKRANPLFETRRYDEWTTGKIQRVTLWASAFLVIVQQVRIPIGRTAAWQSFAAWVENLARPWR
jgi:hypothetical protein